MLLDKHYKTEWIRSLSGLSEHDTTQHVYNKLVPGTEFSKTQKGIVGEDALLVALDSARKAELVVGEPISLAKTVDQPIKIATAHKYPDVLQLSKTHAYIFESRNIFWHPHYDLSANTFVTELRNKLWHEQVYLKENPPVTTRWDKDLGRPVRAYKPEAFVDLKRAIGDDWQKKTYRLLITTVPNYLPAEAWDDLYGFFWDIVFTGHPFYSTLHVQDSDDLNHLLHAQSDLSLKLGKTLTELETEKV